MYIWRPTFSSKIHYKTEVAPRFLTFTVRVNHRKIS